MRQTPAFLAALGIAFADLASKAVAESVLVTGSIPVLPVFTLRLGLNPGVSFGLFAAHTPVEKAVLITITALLITFIGFLAVRAKTGHERVGFAMIVGGALGNWLDRLMDGVVTDFLDFHVGQWHFPAFNVADAAITLGVVTIVTGEVLRHRLSSPSPQVIRGPETEKQHN